MKFWTVLNQIFYKEFYNIKVKVGTASLWFWDHVTYSLMLLDTYAGKSYKHQTPLRQSISNHFCSWTRLNTIVKKRELLGGAVFIDRLAGLNAKQL